MIDIKLLEREEKNYGKLGRSEKNDSARSVEGADRGAGANTNTKVSVKTSTVGELSYLEYYKECLKHRGGDVSEVDALVLLNNERKSLLTKVETAKATQNKVGQEIAMKKRVGEDASALLEQMQSLSAEAKEEEVLLQEVLTRLEEKLLSLPNHCHAQVPVGGSEKDNVCVREWGEKKTFAFKAKEHWELGEAHGTIDFERASKVAGARFAFLKGGAASLERALISFMQDVHTQESGYTEMIPPFIVNSGSLQGTGQFPKFKEDVFHLKEHDYYLIPTAEVPVTNFFAGEILSAADLPISFSAYSPCFRSEAGSYGRDTKGLIRQHQFNKVELLKFCHPEDSYEQHEKLTADAEKILRYLELPYRVMSLCTKDLGFSAAKCYDLEVWLPGQNAYREISSCSNFEDFQARRANIRFRDGANSKPRYVHTLNGSGLAVGRTLIAVMENYQQEDGRIQVPQVLKKYLGREFL